MITINVKVNISI